MVATCSRDDLRAGRADWIANPTLNRTCNSVRRPGLISFWPRRRPLPHAG
jgi:hypothetical protein